MCVFSVQSLDLILDLREWDLKQYQSVVSNSSYRRKLAARPPNYLSSLVVNVKVQVCDLVGTKNKHLKTDELTK